MNYESIRSRVQADQISFLRRVAVISLRDRVRSSVTRERLGVEPLLLRLERSQLRWFGSLVWITPECLPRKILFALLTHWEETPWKTKEKMEEVNYVA